MCLCRASSYESKLLGGVGQNQQQSEPDINASYSMYSYAHHYAQVDLTTGRVNKTLFMTKTKAKTIFVPKAH